ncbi:MAG TPA: GGDEF domain-containing protein [Gaiellaceae bacterium]|nr:GGDEF domain-containing protein [Gaiellaceae bacterium]
MTTLDFLPLRRGRDDARFRRARRRGPVVRVALFLFLLVLALLTAIVVTLSRNANRTNTQQVATELASGARVAVSSFGAVRADLRAQAGQLATSLDLQRAIVANDRSRIAAIARAHHARIHARGETFGALVPEPRLTSTSTIAQGSAVLARVTLALPLDQQLLKLIRASTPLPKNAALVLARNDRVIAGGPIGARASLRNGRVTFGSTAFAAKTSELGIANVTVFAVEPVAAVDARALPYQKKLLITAVLTLALAAGIAARLGRPLARMFGELSDQAETDALTGLANRRTLDERLDEEVDRAQRHGTHLSLVLVDIDDFKQVNDRFGHQSGDDVLRAVAPVFAGTLRELDLAGRFGGEEFAVVLPGTTVAGARGVAEEIRKAFARIAVKAPSGELVRVTASFGVAEFPSCPSIKALIEQADAALYEAKRAGKNRVVAHEAEPVPGVVTSATA